MSVMQLVCGGDLRQKVQLVVSTVKPGRPKAIFDVPCVCRSHPKPIVVDSKPGQQYPASLKCSGTANAPTGRALALTTIEIWHEQLLTGLHMISCQAARQ